jgi:hypothetical protein
MHRADEHHGVSKAGGRIQLDHPREAICHVAVFTIFTAANPLLVLLLLLGVTDIPRGVIISPNPLLVLAERKHVYFQDPAPRGEIERHVVRQREAAVVANTDIDIAIAIDIAVIIVFLAVDQKVAVRARHCLVPMAHLHGAAEGCGRSVGAHYRVGELVRSKGAFHIVGSTVQSSRRRHLGKQQAGARHGEQVVPLR